LANAESNATRYRIVAGKSELRILVFRTGSLARFGHNHVVSTSDLSGTVVAGGSAADGEIDLNIPVASFIVDDPDVRAEEGQAFSAELSEEDINRTRDNMMGRKLLQAREFEEIKVFSDRISGEFPDITIHALITVKGSQHPVELPAIVEIHDDRLLASGATDLSHSQLGLSPFRTAFGTLRVAEKMTFRYRVVARKTDDDDQ
jgi:hypothetical protein